MDKNCLVTRLKGTVENENLPFVGEIILETTDNGGDDFIYVEFIGEVTGAITKRIINSNIRFIDADGNDLGQESTADRVYLPKNTPVGTKIGVRVKYNIITSAIKNVSITLADSYFNANLGQISYNYFDNRDLSSKRIIGSTKDLVKYQNLTVLDIGSAYDFKVNVEDLGQMTKLTRASIITNSTVEGDLVNLVKRQVSEGRNSGNILIGTYNYGWIPARGLMFNGEPVVGDYLDTHLVWSTSEGVTTVNFTSTNKDTLTTTFELQ